MPTSRDPTDDDLELERLAEETDQVWAEGDAEVNPDEGDGP